MRAVLLMAKTACFTTSWTPQLSCSVQIVVEHAVRMCLACKARSFIVGVKQRERSDCEGDSQLLLDWNFSFAANKENRDEFNSSS